MAQPSNNAVEPYTLLRASLSLFQKPPADLDAVQLRKAEIQAQNEYEIETRVLNSLEASAVIITDHEVDSAFAEICQRFDDDRAFEEQLTGQGMTLESLRAALFRQCKVDAVLEAIASRTPKISDVEIGIFYHSHREKFHVPEKRLARHILISINPAYPENTREKSLERIREIAAILQRKPHKFARLALKHSECPSALNGGNLGEITAGKLYPELDAALFGLKENDISTPVETEIGFHLIQCLKIMRAETLSLQKAAPKIRQLMQERYRRVCQRAWLASLKGVKAAVQDC